MRTELYRYFDADDVLLYVGISLTSVRRMSEHRSKSYWYSKAVKITIERFETRIAAFDAEATAILREKPLHNKAGKYTKSTFRDIYPCETDDTIARSTEVATSLGVDIKTLRKWVRQGVCPVEPVNNTKPLQWLRADVAAFCSRGAIQDA